MKTGRTRTRPDGLPSIEELRHMPNLSVRGAMKLMGYSRARVDEHVDNLDWRWFKEGKRVRIITASIFEWQEDQARQNMGRAS
jgi:hypothetical protein